MMFRDLCLVPKFSNGNNAAVMVVAYSSKSSGPVNWDTGVHKSRTDQR